MENMADLNATFRQLIMLASGLENVILAGQTGEIPSDCYATYKPIPVRVYGHSEHSMTEIVPQEAFADSLGTEWTDLQDTVFSSMEFTLSVNIFNEGADNATVRLHNANLRNPVSAFLFRNGIAWRSTSASRDLIALSTSSQKANWQTDIHLFIKKTLSYPVLRAAGFTIDVQKQ